MRAHLIDLTFFEISDEFGKRLLGLRLIVPQSKKHIFHEANYGDGSREFGKQEYSNVPLYLGWPDLSELEAGLLEDVIEKRTKETPKTEKKSSDGQDFEHHYNFSVSEIEIAAETLENLEEISHDSEEFQSIARDAFCSASKEKLS